MKRNYQKPEIKTLQLRLNPFLTTGSNKDPNYGFGDENSEDPGSGVGNAGEGDESRSWSHKMWDDL